MVKGLAHFRPYFWNSHIVAYVLFPEVKDILAQKECARTRGLWVTKIQEYDLEVKIAKIVRGQGLATPMTEKDLELEVINQVNVISDDLQVSDWYRDIIFYLQNFSCPSNFSKTQKRSLQFCAVKYCLWQGRLGWRSPHGLILSCVLPHETHQMMTELHVGGGHFSARTTAHKIMHAGYYWPTLFRDTHAFVRACEPCQRFEGKQRLPSFPLDPVVVEAPFQQWGLDFIGEIPQVSSAGHSWILAAIDYFTRWVEAIPLKTSSSAAIIHFLEENILTRFGVPKKITTDNASVFRSVELVAFFLRFGITLSHSANYYLLPSLYTLANVS
jgi:hypothetical protein